MSRYDEQKLDKFYDGQLVRKLAAYTKGFGIILFLSALMLLAGTLLDLLQPRIISSIIDDYLAPQHLYLEESEKGMEIDGKTYALSKEETTLEIKDGVLYKEDGEQPLKAEEQAALRGYRYSKIIRLVLFLFGLSILTYISSMVEQISLNYVGQRVIRKIRS